MNDLFSDIGKRLPYQESEDYLNNLIETAADNAISRQNAARKRRHWGLIAISAAASIALIAGVGFTIFNQQEQSSVVTAVNDSGPLDEFLNSLTQEEAAQLQYYEIEEIPEY